MKRNGFTIWELLLVIITVVVIAAIMFPGFCGNPQKARQISCASNMKQLGLGIAQYAQDNDQCRPNIAAPDGKEAWRSAIYPYVKSTGVYQCPSRDDKGTDRDGMLRSYAANSAGIVYGGRHDQGDGAFAGPGSLPVKITDSPNAASLIMLCETTGSRQPDFNIDNLGTFDPGSKVLWAGHAHGSNYLFADGHAKWLRPMNTNAFWHRDPDAPLTPGAIAILQDTQDRAGK